MTMDWIHCNTCFSLPSENKLQFNLTSCGHLFCGSCLQKDTEKKCKTCGQKYSGAIVLSNQMKPDVQLYFTEVKDICKNAIKQIQQVQQVSEFQKGHSQRLGMFRKQQLAKATVLINQAKELDRKYKNVLKENEQLKNFIKSQGYQLNDVLPNIESSKHMMTPKTPITPKQLSITPAMVKSHSNNSLMSMNSHMTASPRSTHPMYRSPGVGLQPSPMKINSTNFKPAYSGSLQPSPSSHRSSPLNQPNLTSSQRNGFVSNSQNPMRSSNMLATSGRITMRTPPINGRLGPINSSPHSISPRSHTTPGSANHRIPSPAGSQTSPRNSRIYQNRQVPQFIKGPTSKIAQNLNASRGSPKPPGSGCITPRDERRPIQLQNTRNGLVGRPAGPN